MVVKFDKLYRNKLEIEQIDKSNLFDVAACAVNIMCSYEPNNQDNFIEMLQMLMGDFQPISPLFKQSIRDRMTSNNKWSYIGKSYFKNTSPNNNYELVAPYEVEVEENPYSYNEEGFARLFLKSSGADSPRPITLRKAKDGKWYIWSDSIIGLMTDIRQPEAENPWA